MSLAEIAGHFDTEKKQRMNKLEEDGINSFAERIAEAVKFEIVRFLAEKRY